MPFESPFASFVNNPICYSAFGGADTVRVVRIIVSNAQLLDAVKIASAEMKDRRISKCRKIYIEKPWFEYTPALEAWLPPR